MKAFVLAAAAYWLCSLPCWAQIYITTDEQGRQHYSDSPSQGAQLYRRKNSLQSIPQPQLPKLYPNNTSTSRPKASKQQSKQLAEKQRYCERLEQRIQRLTDKLRGGHSNSEGNRWRKQRRDLSDQRYRDCR